MNSSFKAGSANVSDFVMVLGHGTLEDGVEPQFRQHLNRRGEKVFSIVDHQDFRNTKYVGREDDAGEGFEYVLAMVNKRTKEIQFRQTSVVKFEAKYNANEFLRGTKHEKTDFNNSFNHEADETATKRRKLTLEFGSIQKNKKLEALNKRSINEQTLEVMASTAFMSNEIGSLGAGDAAGLSSISVLKAPESSVLPSKNADAKIISELYNFEQFLPANGLIGRESGLKNYFKQFKTSDDICKLDIGKTIAQRMLNVNNFTTLKPEVKAYFALKVMVMSNIAKYMFISADGRRDVRNISMKVLDGMHPADVVQDIRLEFLGHTLISTHGSQAIRLTTMEKHKFVAHLMCMLLLLDEPHFLLPISPIITELGVPERICTKLLQGLGCMITTATTEQAILLNSMKIAKLVLSSTGNKTFVRRGRRST